MIIWTAADGDEQACLDAQQIWRECLPTPRAFAPRLRGRKVRREAAAPGRLGYDAWQRQRRKTVGALVAADDVETAAAAVHAAATPSWGETHRKESQRQVAQRYLHLMEAADQGLLLEDDRDVATLAAAGVPLQG